MMYAPGMSEEARQARKDRSILKTEGTGWDVGAAVRFLAGDEARWMSKTRLISRHVVRSKLTSQFSRCDTTSRCWGDRRGWFYGACRSSNTIRVYILEIYYVYSLRSRPVSIPELVSIIHRCLPSSAPDWSALR